MSQISDIELNLIILVNSIKFIEPLSPIIPIEYSSDLFEIFDYQKEFSFYLNDKEEFEIGNKSICLVERIEKDLEKLINEVKRSIKSVFRNNKNKQLKLICKSEYRCPEIIFDMFFWTSYSAGGLPLGIEVSTCKVDPRRTKHTIRCAWSIKLI
jgi:hypothetical protein